MIRIQGGESFSCPFFRALASFSTLCVLFLTHISHFLRYGSPGTTRSTFSLLEWSESPTVVDAWKTLAQNHGLLLDPFKDRAQIFGMTDSAVIGGWALSLSMRKARKRGWLGSVNSYEAAFYCLKDLARLRVAVPLAVPEFEEVVLIFGRDTDRMPMWSNARIAGGLVGWWVGLVDMLPGFMQMSRVTLDPCQVGRCEGTTYGSG